MWITSRWPSLKLLYETRSSAFVALKLLACALISASIVVFFKLGLDLSANMCSLKDGFRVGKDRINWISACRLYGLNCREDCTGKTVSWILVQETTCDLDTNVLEVGNDYSYKQRLLPKVQVEFDPFIVSLSALMSNAELR